jgi:hypothetical protein
MIPGPHPVGVERLPGGAALDLAPFLRSVLVDLVRLREREPERFEELVEAIATAESARCAPVPVPGAARAVEGAVDELLDELGDLWLFLYGVAVELLAGRLMQCVNGAQVRAA